MAVDPPRLEIKVLDASRFRTGTDAERKAFADELGSALIKDGFVKLINHGITKEMVKEATSIVWASPLPRYGAAPLT